MREIPSKGFILFLLALAFCVDGNAQQINSLVLEEAYEIARQHYPLAENESLIEEISALNTQIISRNRLPLLTFNAQASIQSDNVQIGGNDPGFPINIDAPLDTYKAYLSLNYHLFDGGISTSQKKIESANKRAGQEALEVMLYSLKGRINLLFFNVELARQQRALLATSLSNIEANLAVIESRVRNGVLLESEHTKLKVRRLELLSEIEQRKGDELALLSILEQLLGQELDEQVALEFPSISANTEVEINRPEQNLFLAQQEVLTAQKKGINATKMPTLSLFGESGVGNPNPVNFTDVETSLYGIVGLKLSWNFLDWGKSKKEKERIDLQTKQTAVDKLTFEFDLLSRKGEYLEKMKAMRNQIENDQEIVALQNTISEEATAQLKNGVINTSEYLEEVNAELEFKQRLKLHEIMLEQMNIEYLTLFGTL